MWIHECGLISSTFVTLPCSVTGRLTSNSVENAWCALAETPVKRHAAAAVTIMAKRIDFSPLRQKKGRLPQDDARFQGTPPSAGRRLVGICACNPGIPAIPGAQRGGGYGPGRGAEIGAGVAQALLQRGRRRSRAGATPAASARSAAVPGGLAHDEARSGDPRRRLAFVGHRRAPAGDAAGCRRLRHDDPVRELVEPARPGGVNTNFTSPLMCASTGQPLTPIVSGSRGSRGCPRPSACTRR